MVTLAFAQKSFEGEVIYSISLQSHMANVTDEQINSLIGDTQHYYMKGANYKSTFNGTYGLWALYIDKDKKYYEKSTLNDSVIWRDVNINHDSITNAELKKNDTTILGYRCDKLIFTCRQGLQIYYFNSQLAVDPNLYINHQEGSWYAFLEKSRSLALKEIIHKRLLTFTLTATSIKRVPIEDSLFELPPGVPLIKSRVK